MSTRKTRLLTALAAAGIVATGIVYTPASQAVNFGDFMNPGKWMGGNKDRDEDWYDYGSGPYGLPPGAGPYGVPYGAPYGAVPGYGPYGGPRYGGAGYGAPGYYGAPSPRSQPAPRAPAPASSASSSSQNVKSAEIEALKRRIEELEAKQQPSYAAPPPPADWGSSSSPSPSTSGWGSAPAFRPMNKY